MNGRLNRRGNRSRLIFVSGAVLTGVLLAALPLCFQESGPHELLSPKFVAEKQPAQDVRASLPAAHVRPTDSTAIQPQTQEAPIGWLTEAMEKTGDARLIDMATELDSMNQTYDTLLRSFESSQAVFYRAAAEGTPVPEREAETAQELGDQVVLQLGDLQQQIFSLSSSLTEAFYAHQAVALGFDQGT